MGVGQSLLQRWGKPRLGRLPRVAHGFRCNRRSMMHASTAKSINAGSGRKQDGFSVLEMIAASAILMVGIVSVVQLVPASLRNSVGHGMDTMATVIAQRELDQILSQPLTANTFQDRDGQ